MLSASPFNLAWPLLNVRRMGSLPSFKKHLGAPLQSRKAMLETLFRHLGMVRLSVGAMVMLAMIGCTGLIDGGSDGLTTQERNARAKFQKDALPVLELHCGGCHAGQRAMLDFMTGDDALDIRDRLKAYDPPVVNFEAPGSSRLLTKGQHDGPMLSAVESAAVLQWLQAEQESKNNDPDNPLKLLATPPFAVQVCPAGAVDSTACPVNRVSITDLGDPAVSVPGAEITFTAMQLTSGLYVTNLKLNGGTAGAYIEHPLFVSRPTDADPIPDQIDRFFALKLNGKPNAVEQLQGGTAQFAGFAADAMLEIHFKTIAAFKPDTGGGPVGGCKVLASFKTNVVPRLQASCANCHANANNANARSTMDLTGMNSADDAMVQLVCNQVRSRADLVNTNNSPIYLAPQPGNGTAHPFKFPDLGTFNTFKTSVDLWVQAEKIAP